MVDREEDRLGNCYCGQWMEWALGAMGCRYNGRVEDVV